jgi:hypothetical protein
MKRVEIALIAALCVWFAAAVIGGGLGIFDTPGRPPGGLALFILLPIGAFVVAYLASPAVRGALALVPLWLMTLTHVWRFIGVGFVIGAARGNLPEQFGYSAGIGDIVAGAAAVPLAAALLWNPGAPGLRAWYVAWNVFGLVDLLSAITTGILYSPSSFGILREAASTRAMAQFPTSLIPTFFVPLFILTHLLGLRRSGEISTERYAQVM